MRYIDLFAGVGGFHLGINKAHSDWECVYSSEWDKYANSVYKKHFGECDSRDIREVSAKEIPDHDLLVGGFPCQSFSVAGKRGGFADTRGTMFFEIARILKEKQPRLLLLENVKGLLNHDQGRTLGVILTSLDELGYDVQWQVLNSKDFGVPQNRERVFIVGHLRGTARPEVFSLTRQSNQYSTLGQSAETAVARTLTGGGHSGGNHSGMTIIGTLRTHKDGQGFREMKSGLAPTIPARARNDGSGQGVVAIPVLTPDRAEKRQNGRRFKTDGEPAFTLTQQDIHGVMVNRKEGIKKQIDIAVTLSSSDWRGLNRNQDQTAIMENMAIRRLTPIECERLQGFPDGWTEYGADGEKISDTQRYKMMGNAVTTNVVTAVAERLV